MNLLFIVTEYNSANGICAEKIMECLISHGHIVHCLTNHLNKEKRSADNKSIIFHYLKPRLFYRISNSIKPKNFFNRVILFFIKALNTLKMLIMFPFLPLISPSYEKRIFKGIERICKLNEIDIVVPIFSTIDSLIAATRIKKKNKNIKLIPYFLDSLSGGYPSRLLGQKRTMRRGFFYEDKLLPYADLIIMMRSSEEHYKRYSSKKDYYSKIIFLDLPLFTDHYRKITRHSNVNDEYVISFVGSMPPFRNPSFFVKLFMGLSDKKIKLIFIGDSSYVKYLQKVSKTDNRIKIIGRVEHKKALEYLEKSDCLLNLGNSVIGMTPSKILEYISFCKPIISTAPIANEPSIFYLNLYPASLILFENNSYDENLRKLDGFIKRSKKINIDISQFDKVFYKNKPEAFFDALTNKKLL